MKTSFKKNRQDRIINQNENFLNQFIFFCLRRPKTFLKKGFWTSKNFLLRWFLLSFFLCAPLHVVVAKTWQWIHEWG